MGRLLSSPATKISIAQRPVDTRRLEHGTDRDWLSKPTTLRSEDQSLHHPRAVHLRAPALRIDPTSPEPSRVSSVQTMVPSPLGQPKNKRLGSWDATPT